MRQRTNPPAFKETLNGRHRIKTKSGKTIRGEWYARVRYTGADGRRHAIWRVAANKTDAADIARDLERELFQQGEKSVKNSRKTFNELADFYEEHYLIAAEYVDGRRVRGRRGLTGTKSMMQALRESFGNLVLRDIRYSDLARFKAKRLKQPTRLDRARLKRELVTDPKATLKCTRFITSVHRDLQLLRHILNVAEREGWLLKNPFNTGDGLINPADERKRTRVLSMEEETRLLAACGARTLHYTRKGRAVEAKDTGDSRAHLRAIIIALLDTAMRSGEAFKLRVRDLSLDPRRITVQEFNTKTLRMRAAPISKRLGLELAALIKEKNLQPSDLVFGITSSIKKSFSSACREAGITDLRIHDLRRTAATRLLRGGMKMEEVSRILGHTSIEMSYRYVGVNDETTDRAADIFDELNS